jgi:hypothetical protein
MTESPEEYEDRNRHRIVRGVVFVIYAGMAAVVLWGLILLAALAVGASA